ncbi:hypothetical protein [Colwellia sp. E150_009]
MNPLFNLPLHGVFCAPFCCAEKNNLPIQIDLDFTSTTVPNTTLTSNTGEPIWSMVDKGERYYSEVNLFKSEFHHSNKHELHKSNINNRYYLQINCQGSGLFKISKKAISINWQAQGTGADHYFQTLAIALNLELNNVLCIHANALAYKNKAIAIMAPSRTGKTTLTAALSQQGFALMTDDMVALHEIKAQEQDNSNKAYKIYPSWPVARMWPDSLKDIPFTENQEHQKVHEKFEKRTVNLTKTKAVEFCEQPKELQVIYLLNRLPPEQTKEQIKEHEINKETNTKNNNKPIGEIVSIGTAQALILLLQNSILGSCYSALKLEKSRLQAFSTLLENIAFKQINYPSGKEHLNEIGELIKKDLESYP